MERPVNKISADEKKVHVPFPAAYCHPIMFEDPDRDDFWSVTVPPLTPKVRTRVVAGTTAVAREDGTVREGKAFADGPEADICGMSLTRTYMNDSKFERGEMYFTCRDDYPLRLTRSEQDGDGAWRTVQEVYVEPRELASAMREQRKAYRAANPQPARDLGEAQPEGRGAEALARDAGTPGPRAQEAVQQAAMRQPVAADAYAPWEPQHTAR